MPRAHLLLPAVCSLLLLGCDWFPSEEPKPCEHPPDTSGTTTTGSSSGATTDPSGTTDPAATASSGSSGFTSTGDTEDPSGSSSAGVELDSDLDGIIDMLDNCPFVANPLQEDGDTDEWGNACDSCPYSSGVGGAPEDHCCDPRSYTDCQPPPFAPQVMVCGLPDPGTRFTCNYHVLGCATAFGSSCDCAYEKPCVPAEALIPPEYLYGTFQCFDGGSSCHTRWCTIGGDSDQCLQYVYGTWPNYWDVPTCEPYFAPGIAPDGLEDLGICMKAHNGPCSGLLGSECAALGN